MNLFNKSKFKRRENQNAGRSQLGWQDGNASLANFSPPGPSIQDEGILVQDCLNIIDRQAAEINELKHQLNLNGSALDDCLRQKSFASYQEASLNNELQRATDEITQLKNLIEVLDQRAEEQDEKAREITNIVSQHRAELMRRTQEAARAMHNTTKKFNEQIDALRTELVEKERDAARVLDNTTRNFNQQIDTLQTELMQRAQETARVNDELDLERSEKSRAQEIAGQLAEQLSLKGEKIHEQDSQIQTQTDTLEQTCLSLNRTRNELNQEKQRAARAVRECATKSQQLEFVQQQCASLQEQLRSRNT
jgi:chromosome segregation ATPase